MFPLNLGLSPIGQINCYGQRDGLCTRAGKLSARPSTCRASRSNAHASALRSVTVDGYDSYDGFDEGSLFAAGCVKLCSVNLWWLISAILFLLAYLSYTQ